MAVVRQILETELGLLVSTTAFQNDDSEIFFIGSMRIANYRDVFNRIIWQLIGL